MLLIVGLGNPGSKYQKTRHNIGFMVVDYLAKELSFPGFISKFKSEYSEKTINGQKVILLKPTTYMNLSGNAVLEVSKFYKIEPNEIIVIYDDIYLPPGKLRYRKQSGSGGHNGVASIQQTIGNNFHKIKVGVGKPPHDDYNLSDYVLSNFSNEELKTHVNNTLTHFKISFKNLLAKDFETFINNHKE